MPNAQWVSSQRRTSLWSIGSSLLMQLHCNLLKPSMSNWRWVFFSALNSKIQRQIRGDPSSQRRTRPQSIGSSFFLFKCIVCRFKPSTSKWQWPSWQCRIWCWDIASSVLVHLHLSLLRMCLRTPLLLNMHLNCSRSLIRRRREALSSWRRTWLRSIASSLLVGPWNIPLEIINMKVAASLLLKCAKSCIEVTIAMCCLVSSNYRCQTRGGPSPRRRTRCVTIDSSLSSFLLSSEREKSVSPLSPPWRGRSYWGFYIIKTVNCQWTTL